MRAFPDGWMGWLLIAAGLFFLAFLVVCASHIVLIGRLTRKGEDDQLSFHIHALFGLINYAWEAPIMKMGAGTVNVKTETRRQMSAQPDSESKSRVGVRTVRQQIEDFRMLTRYTDRFYNWVGQTLRRVKLEEWHWQTRVGAGDAVWTAMACGAAWAVQGTVLGICSQLFSLRAEPRMTVAPVYSHEHFSTEWSCIAKIRFGYAIVAGLQLLVRIRRVKGGFTTWQNILSKG